jgi:hypothetical protein
MDLEWADSVQDSEEDSIASHPVPIVLAGLLLSIALTEVWLMIGEL